MNLSKSMSIVIVIIISTLCFHAIGDNTKGIDFTVTPEKPVRGDIVSVSGHAKPKDYVKALVSFSGEVPIDNGKYTLSMNNLDIPFEDIKFTVTVHGCTSIEISGRKPLWSGLYTPWVTITADAVDDTATLSYSISPGKYDVSLCIRSNQKQVRVDVIAAGLIKTGEDGVFSYSYDTSMGVPGVD